MMHYSKIIREMNRTVARYFSVLFTLKVHCSYRLKCCCLNHLRNRSFYNHSLPGSRFDRQHTLHRGCGMAHAQMHCHPEKRKIRQPSRGGWNVSDCHMTATRLEFFSLIPRPNFSQAGQSDPRKIWFGNETRNVSVCSL